MSIKDKDRIYLGMIERLWDGPKSGDEYRSICLQTKRFVNNFFDSTSPYSWLPNHLLSEQDIIEFGCTIHYNSKENRLLYNRLKTPAIHNYKEVIALKKNMDGNTDTEMIYRGVPSLEDTISVDICHSLGELRNRIAAMQTSDFLTVIQAVRQEVDYVYEQIAFEKGLYRTIGLKQIAYSYQDQYIILIDTLLRFLFLSLVFNTPASRDWSSFGDTIQNYISDLKTRASSILKAEEDVLLRKRLDSPRDSLLEYVTTRFAQYHAMQGFWHEAEQIFAIIEKETVLHSADFSSVQKPIEAFSRDEVKPRKLISELSDGVSIDKVTQKIAETDQLMEFAAKNGNMWCNKNDIRMLKGVFQEVFLRKLTYRRKQSMTIARELLAAPEYVEQTHLHFLDCKILRGLFREYGHLDKYEAYSSFSHDLRDLLLQSYRALDDRVAYALLNDIAVQMITWFTPLFCSVFS